MCEDDLNALIQKLDADIARYSKLATDARLERNRYMLVSQLPTEILCRIFLFTRDACIMSSSKYAWLKDLTWIRAVSHVCHQWRRIALHEVRLWTHPPLESIHWTRTMLERSKKAGLSIKLNIDFGARNVYIPVFDHLPHIQRLSIHKSTSRGLDHILGYLEDVPAPMLESLCICCAHIYQDRTSFRLPDNVLLETPNLRQLCLTSIVTDWTSPIFSSSLTTLKLRDLPFGSDPTFPQLWALLEHLPELEVIGLAWAVLSDDQLLSDEVQVVRRRQPIPLWKMTKVEFEGRQPHLQFLVDNIAFSQDIQSIHITIMHTHTSTLGRLISDTSAAFSTVFSPREISIRRKNRLTPLFFDITAVAFERPSVCRRLEAAVRRFNLFAPQSDPLSDTEIDVGFTELFKSFRWTNLAVLELNGLARDCLPSADSLADTFGSLPSINTVRVARATASLFAETLQHGVEQPLDDSASHTPLSSQCRVPFPGLCVIIMLCVEFHMGATDDEAEDVDELSVNYHNFTECLRNRRNRGMPIRSMELLDCESGPLDSRALKEVMLPLLQELVDSIRWVVPDLYVDFFTDDEDSEDCL